MKWEFKSKTSVYFILQEEASGAIKAANAGKIVSPSLDALIRAASVPWSWGLRSWLIVFLSKFASSVRVLADFNTAWGALTQEREFARASAAITCKRALGCHRTYSSGHILADARYGCRCGSTGRADFWQIGKNSRRTAKTRLLKFGNLAIEIWKNKIYRVKRNSINLAF